MKQIIKKISDNFIQEAKSSPRMLEDLAAMERYMSESYDGRTFVELLQNADDANASRIVVFTVGTSLIVANDGRHFDENDIMAICRSGASSKQRGNSIGYRGVGFKSATTISTEIIIYSANTYFTFSKSVCAEQLGKNEAQVPTVRIPFLYDEGKLETDLIEKIEEYESDGFTTFFVFREGKIEKFIKELNGFNAGWLLFLKNVGSVEINCGIHKTKSKITRKTVNDTDTLIKVVGSKDQWYIMSKESVSIAFKYDSEKGIIECAGEEAVFHCFLPTLDKTGFPFKANADFSTDPSRKHIIHDESTKKAMEILQKMYAELICRVIVNSDEKLYTVLSLLNSHTTLNDLVVELENGILTNLRTMSWVPLRNGQYVSPENAFMLPKWIETSEKLLIEDVSKTISNKVVNHSIFNQIEKGEHLLAKIGTKELSNSVLAELLSNLDIVKQLPHSLIGKIFAYCNRAKIENQAWMNLLFVPLDEGFVQMENVSSNATLCSDFCTTIKAIFNENELNNLILMYPIFECLKQRRPRAGQINLKKIGNQTENMAKSMALAINKWKSPVQNCMAVETLNGNTVKDVKRKCDEYDVISTAKDGEISYIAVKEVAVLGDSFKLSEQEYSAAQRLGDSYKIYVFSTETSEIEFTVICNPIDFLKLEKVVKEWEWLSGPYETKNLNAVEPPLIMDEKILKTIDKSFFNSAQQEFLQTYLNSPDTFNIAEYKSMIGQINFIFDFHTGENFFTMKNAKYIVDEGKKATLKQILK